MTQSLTGPPEGTLSQVVLDEIKTGHRTFDLDNLLTLRRALLRDNPDAASFRSEFDAIVDSVEDDALASLYARAQAKIDATIAEYEWAKKVADAGIFRRMVARATPAPTEHLSLHDADAEVADVELKAVKMPHPSLDIALEPIYGAYCPDPDVIESILPKLKEDEREKALTIIPERKVPRQVIAAHTLPRELRIGATGSLKALRDRYKDSAVGKILARELRREFKGWKLTIKPVPTKPDARNVTPSQKALS